MRKITPILLIIGAFLLGACQKRENGAIVAQGVVDGTILTLKSQVAGSVVIHVKAGQEVRQNDLIAEVDRQKLDTQMAALELDKAEMALSRISLAKSIRLTERQLAYFKHQDQRFSRLVDKGSLPLEKKEGMELQRLQAETQLFDLGQKMAQLDLTEKKLSVRESQLNLQLADHVFHAKRRGWILETHLESGETVFPGSAILDLLTDDDLTIDIFLEEIELSGIAVAGQAEVMVDGREASLPARVQTISRQAEFSSKYIISEKERQSLLYKVTIGLPPDSSLKIGQPVSVRIHPKG
jgi:HlyD family secretion protein